MSAFVPATNSDVGHQNQVPSSSFNYQQLPYFASMIGPCFGPPNGYQFNPVGGIPNAFPNIGHNPAVPMNPMDNLHSQPQLQQMPVDPSNAFRFFHNNQLSLYNNDLMKGEFVGPPSIPTIQNIPLINDSKSSSTNDSRSGESSPADGNRTPSRAIKPSAKITKQGLKSPDDENAYRSRRQKNNEAARLSRVRRQQRERQLQEENDQLKRELEQWKQRYNALVTNQLKQGHVLSEIQNHTKL